MLTRRAFLTGKRVAMDIRNHDVSIDRQLSLEGGRWQIYQTELTERTLKI